jgi:hypothetical protein
MAFPTPDLRGIWGFPFPPFDGPRLDLAAYASLVAHQFDGGGCGLPGAARLLAAASTR